VTVTPIFEASAGGGPGRPSALLLAQAEELLATLPGVVSVRIEAAPQGEIVAIHVLTSVEVAPKQTVRNIESALLAHLGLRVDHRKISVATTVDAPRLRPSLAARDESGEAARRTTPYGVPTIEERASGPTPILGMPAVPPVAPALPSGTPVVPLPVPPFDPSPAPAAATVGAAGPVGRRTPVAGEAIGRRYVFDDVEVRRSRTGLHCRVTLHRGDESFEGEAEGLETEAARLELAARATVLAIAYAEGRTGGLALAGIRRLEAFGRDFAFAGVSVRQTRESQLLTGSCEIRDSVEIAGVLAVLDATNRWLAVGK
jgi:hypothetical protein